MSTTCLVYTQPTLATPARLVWLAACAEPVTSQTVATALPQIRQRRMQSGVEPVEAAEAYKLSIPVLMRRYHLIVTCRARLQ